MPRRRGRGSMVAYQGDVEFERKGSSGVGEFLKKKMTGEGLPLMRIRGSGAIFLANMGADVHVIELENESISINGANILAYEATLQSDIRMVRGAGIMAGGLFNTTLSGTGQVAIVTDGSPLVLNTPRHRPSSTPTPRCAGRPTCRSSRR